jgi:hypothetical protein
VVEVSIAAFTPSAREDWTQSCLYRSLIVAVALLLSGAACSRVRTLRVLHEIKQGPVEHEVELVEKYASSTSVRVDEDGRGDM